MGEFENALADFTEVIRQEPHLASHHHNRAAAYYEIGALDDAIRDYTEAIRLDPSLRKGDQ